VQDAIRQVLVVVPMIEIRFDVKRNISPYDQDGGRATYTGKYPAAVVTRAGRQQAVLPARIGSC